MTDNRCFIQLPHPGHEHDRGCGENWHSFLKDHGHQRKFMEFQGEWIDKCGATRRGNLWAWGEWEAESGLVRCFDQSRGAEHPARLWRPHYVPRDNYRGLHNTDPFIFGECFLYSNCGQQRAAGAPGKRLKHLESGSLIMFGSCSGGKWMLDTVFVVADSWGYRAKSMKADIAHAVPKEFVDVTVMPITSNERPELALRLYRGATPMDRVDGMFSFFPR